MTGRDRIVVIVIVVVALLGAGWMMLVSPERKEAASLETQVSQARSQLATAQGQLTEAKAAQAKYASAYASVVSLGKAVPPSQEVASLIYQLSAASGERNVGFNSISAGGSGGSSSSSSSSATATAAAASAGFTQMPFSFVFTGGFFNLEKLFRQISGFTTHTASGLGVSGRLLTIQSLSLTPQNTTTPGKGSNQLTGTITATAYVLPATQGLTAGATPASPAGAATPVSSSSSGASSPAPPAVAKVTP